MAIKSTLATLLFASASALHNHGVHHHHRRASVTPKVSGIPQVVGLVSDPKYNRDSCTSVRIHSRELWTCRDTQTFLADGQPEDGIFASSTASWTDFNPDGTPKLETTSFSEQDILLMYGNNTGAYFSLQSDECNTNQAGACGDGTRYAIWPDTRPMPVNKGSNGHMAAYTFVKRAHITDSLGVVDKTPATSLYRSDYTPSSANNDPSETHDDLPAVTLVDETFWPEGSIPYGDYGFVISNGTAYLYGSLDSGIALARVSLDDVEDSTAYEFYVGSEWTHTRPGLNDTTAAVANAGTGGRGTFYYSAYFSSYMWIGAPYYGANAEFYLSTAPQPEGPWTSATLIYTGAEGNASLPAYSQQAHPGLSQDYGSGKDIYLTYTKVDSVYSTPLIHLLWQ